MRMMLKIQKALALLLLLGACTSLHAAGPRPQVKMGESYGRDSSKWSGRSFPKRLVVPKGSLSVGLQATYLSLDASDSQFYMLLTGGNAKASLFRVAPSFSWAYANNRALGLRLGYMDASLQGASADFSLFDDALQFSLSDTDMHLRSYSAGLYHRHYFGLDRRGIFALFADLQLGYAYSRTGNRPGGSAAYSEDHRIALSFCPGFEVFVMNNFSLQLSLGLADLAYHMTRSHDGTGAVGLSDTYKAHTRLNLTDLNFGMTLYW